MATFPSKVNYATGDILTATNMNDVGGAINLLQSAQFAAGKNAIINGDFGVNQRNFTSNTTSNAYNFDRFSQVNGGTGATLTVTPQTFTPGTAPVAGYEGTNFVRCVTTNGSDTTTFSIFSQRVEDVRTLAGQTATFSFWAKAASGTPKVSFEIEQSFGSGGSSAVTLAASSGTTISTSWTRYTVTINVPSVSGKTIGAGSYLGVYLWVSAGSAFNSRANSIGLQTGTFDFWGVQLEAASTASNFQTATGTKQGELAACQRYYEIGTSGFVGDARLSGLKCGTWTQFSTLKRSAPTITVTSTAASGFNGTAASSDIYTNGFISSQNSSGVAGGTVFYFNSFTASSEL